MRNQILFIILFYGSIHAFSQHMYLYEYNASFSSSATGTPLYFESTISTNAGQLSSFNQTRPSSININEFKIIEFSQEITSITSVARYSPGFVTGCNNITNNSKTSPFSGCFTNVLLISETFFPFQCLNKTINSFKLIKIQNLRTVNNLSPTTNELKECESRNISISSGCQYKYALEYKIPTNPNWEELLPYGNNAMTTSIAKSDFPGLNSGENLQIRARFLPAKGTSQTNAYSDIITYNIVSCSPEFKGVIPQAITCNGYEDGSLELKIGRDLNSNEKLAVTLFQEDITSGDFIIIPTGGQKFEITTLTNNGDGTFSYFWPEELPAGNFKIKYQTVNMATAVEPSSFDALNFIGTPFEINSVTPVMFSITNISDQTCFNKNDGYIDVSATREAGRGLFFQLTKNGNIQVFNGTNWVNYTGSDPKNETFNSFSSTTTTRINKLGKGDYRVKVRDSQKCYMK